MENDVDMKINVTSTTMVESVGKFISFDVLHSKSRKSFYYSNITFIDIQFMFIKCFKDSHTLLAKGRSTSTTH